MFEMKTAETSKNEGKIFKLAPKAREIFGYILLLLLAKSYFGLGHCMMGGGWSGLNLLPKVPSRDSSVTVSASKNQWCMVQRARILF